MCEAETVLSVFECNFFVTRRRVRLHSSPVLRPYTEVRVPRPRPVPVPVHVYHSPLHSAPSEVPLTPENREKQSPSDPTLSSVPCRVTSLPLTPYPLRVSSHTFDTCRLQRPDRDYPTITPPRPLPTERFSFRRRQCTISHVDTLNPFPLTRHSYVRMGPVYRTPTTYFT